MVCAACLPACRPGTLSVINKPACVEAAAKYLAQYYVRFLLRRSQHTCLNQTSLSFLHTLLQTFSSKTALLQQFALIKIEEMSNKHEKYKYPPPSHKYN